MSSQPNNQHSDNQNYATDIREQRTEIPEEAQREQEEKIITSGNADEKEIERPSVKSDQKDPGTERKESPNNNNFEGGKKNKRPTSISLRDKSSLFRKIIDIALACEKQEQEIKELSEKNSDLYEKCEKLKEERASLIQQLKEKEALYQNKLDEISELKNEVARRIEVIGIVKADKSESAQEYKNAIAAALKTYYSDFIELKEMATDDISLAFIDTFENVIKVLEKNGIVIG